MGIEMNKIVRLGVAGLLAFAVFGCESSESSLEVNKVDEISELTEADSSKTDSKENPQKDSKDSSKTESKDSTKTDSKDDPREETQSDSTKVVSIDPDSNQSETIQELQVVYHDFDASYPDFNNFQSEAYESQMDSLRDSFKTWKYLGYADNEDWVTRRTIPDGYDTYGCGNANTPEYGELLKGDNSAEVWYGEFMSCGESVGTSMRGLVHELCTDATDTWDAQDENNRSCDKYCKGYIWAKRVYITSGMVKPTLEFPKGEDGKPNLLEPVITKARNACDNKYFEQWFADNELNRRSEGKLALAPIDEKSMGLSYDWNNGGFYPLDSVSDNLNFVSANLNYPNQFGAQGLSIYCPPYDYMFASSQKDYLGRSTSKLCADWLSLGGPRVGDAAVYAALGRGNDGLRHLRNSGFTMMGYAPFKYKKDADKVFEFASLGDMWVFVDGVLALDLGGTHLPANGKVVLKDLASDGHGCHADDPLAAYCEGRVDDKGAWKDGSWHHLHVFYADRSVDGSTFYLKF
jgi:fibro-slime domain-containing protein